VIELLTLVGWLCRMSTIAAVQEKSELDAVLSSRILDRAPTLAQFLIYVCSNTLKAQRSRSKSTNIAVQALGRPPDFDQKKDSIVRVEAHKLRGVLHEYYEAEGADHEIRIEIPPGQYAPRFVFQSAPTTLTAPSYVEEDISPAPVTKLTTFSAVRPGWRKLVPALLGVLAVSVVIAGNLLPTNQSGPVLGTVNAPAWSRADLSRTA